MAAISTLRVMQHGQTFSLFFRNRIQCIAVYQLHDSQALLNLRRGYFNLLDASHLIDYITANSRLDQERYLLNILPNQNSLDSEGNAINILK